MGKDSYRSNIDVANINILLLETNPQDVKAIQQCLSRSRHKFKLDWVNNRQHFLNALKHSNYDLILAEYDLTEIKGIDLLSLTREHFVNLPFIFVSHLEDEEIEIAALQNGATDFVLKRRLSTLPIAIDRVLASRENAFRFQRHSALEEFAECQSLFNRTMVGIAYIDANGSILQANPRLCEMLGYSSTELLGNNFDDIAHTQDDGKSICVTATLKRLVRSDGTYVWANYSSYKLNSSNGESCEVIFLEDISGCKQVEVNLQRSQNFLTSIINSSLDGIMCFQAIRNQKGNIIDFEWMLVNPAAAKIVNRTPEQLIGKRLLEVMPGNKAEGLFDIYVQVVETGKPSENEFYYKYENIAGWFQNIAIKVDNDIFAVTFRDITSQKKTEMELQVIKGDLERRIHRRTAELNIANRLLHDEIIERARIEDALAQNESRLRLALAAAEMGTWEWDIIEDQMFYSAQAEAILGLEPGSFVGSCVASLELIHPEDRQIAYQKKHQSVANITPYKMEERIIRPDGTIRWVAIQGDLVLGVDGKPSRMHGVIADITDRKRAEAEVLQTLERERELNELKSRFVSMVSHEFRNPLAVILSAAETLEKYEAKLTPERKQRRLEHIKNSCEEMNSLLEDVLVLARAESGKLAFNPACLNLKKFCSELVDKIMMAHVQGSEQGNTSTIEFIYLAEYEDVHLDKRLLQHILANLLSNAIKYSPQGEKVEFTVESNLNQIIFTVRDYGIGIPKADLPRLFESFYRASNVKNITGTGLGLSIVKRSVELHNGEVSVTSKKGEGTVFTVTVPTFSCH
jgi:PAS domain S-box-containing protein